MTVYPRSLGYQQLTSLAAAVGMTIPSGGAEYAIIQAETQNVRWRDDGTSPTTTVGHLLPAGSELVYSGPLSAIRFIETTASAKLNITCYSRSY